MSYLELVEHFLASTKAAIAGGDSQAAYSEAVKLSVAADELCDELHEIATSNRKTLAASKK